VNFALCSLLGHALILSSVFFHVSLCFSSSLSKVGYALELGIIKLGFCFLICCPPISVTRYFAAAGYPRTVEHLNLNFDVNCWRLLKGFGLVWFYSMNVRVGRIWSIIFGILDGCFFCFCFS